MTSLMTVVPAVACGALMCLPMAVGMIRARARRRRSSSGALLHKAASC